MSVVVTVLSPVVVDCVRVSDCVWIFAACWMMLDCDCTADWMVVNAVEGIEDVDVKVLLATFSACCATLGATAATLTVLAMACSTASCWAEVEEPVLLITAVCTAALIALATTTV